MTANTYTKNTALVLMPERVYILHRDEIDS